MKKLIPILLFVLSAMSLMATHERAGEITYRHLSGLTYEFTITTYTYAPSPADRPSLEIKWGDGSTDILSRVNGPTGFNPAGIWVDHVGEIIGPNIRKNIYLGTHTFPAPSAYTISLEDPNRNAGVINIPNSVDVPFYIETVLVISPFLGVNNSVQLLLSPVDMACVRKTFIHNTGAFDPDGDSLSFRLVACRGLSGAPIPGYVLPAASRSIAINAVTGDLIWDQPTMQGEYNLAILIEEWRRGVKIGSVVRDLQVIVGVCEANPNAPVLNVPSQLCLVAGEQLQFNVVATDADNHRITLTAAGEPLLLSANAALFQQPVDSIGRVSSRFIWTPACSQIRKIPYVVYFKAQDNGVPVQLVDVKSMNIYVIGPPPKNLTATPSGGHMQLTWQKSACPNVTGYKLYRRINSSSYVPGECITGVPSSAGFQLIRQTHSINDTTYTDTGGTVSLVQSTLYCYLVVATYPDGSESYASNQACAELPRHLPSITHVSILSTSNNGQIYLAWSKPTNIPSSQSPALFRYIIRRAALPQSNYVVVDSTSSINDTVYYNSGLNTANTRYSYLIDMISLVSGARVFVGSSQPASSVFLQISPNDNVLNLSWNLNVPWNNSRYIIYRQNSGSSTFDSIGQTTGTTFADRGVRNGLTYCYKVLSIGSYTVPGIVKPLLNSSQERCAVPADVAPPCAPLLIVETDCNLYVNKLSWTNTNHFCPNTSDTHKYYIWYRTGSARDFILLDSTMRAIDTAFIHRTQGVIDGCYAVTAFDINSNMSVFSNEICIQPGACPQYSLPNIFTPNGDGYNDLLVPYPYSGVESIDLKIFNRWGRLVFRTRDPEIKWNGKSIDTNKDSPDGVYFYSCQITEAGDEGSRKRTIQGSIHIIR